MSYRVNYQQHLLFAGPAPSSGFHFINSSGTTNNNYFSGLNNNNLLKNIDHLYSFSDSFELARTNITQLGNVDNVVRAAIGPVPTNLQFSYYVANCSNLNNLGFLINTGQGHVPLLSGIYTRETANYRDKRNLFLVLGQDGDDLLYQTLPANTFVDQRHTGFKVYAYGDCYVNSYSTNASVGNIPTASIGYVAENIVFYASGSGISIPSINPKDRTLFSGNKFNIPPAVSIKTVLIPGNIDITIASSSAIENIGTIVSDLSIQNYSIAVDFNRSSLDSIGYKLPLDRPINFPIVGSFGCESIFSTFGTGDITQLLSKDIDYNITISMRSGFCNSVPVMRYDLLGCKFKNAQSSIGLGNNKTVSLSFDFQLYPNRVDKGVFISGSV